MKSHLHIEGVELRCRRRSWTYESRDKKTYWRTLKKQVRSGDAVKFGCLSVRVKDWKYLKRMMLKQVVKRTKEGKDFWITLLENENHDFAPLRIMM